MVTKRNATEGHDSGSTAWSGPSSRAARDASGSSVQTSGRYAPVSGTPYASESFAQFEQGERKRHVGLIVAIVLIVAVVAAVGVFSWDRWLRHDDALDIQGTWVVSGTSDTVVIDADSIWISDDVAYSYTIDTKAKTITFTFGNLSGAARYWFSSDRSELILVDGQNYTWISTLVQDVGLCASQVASVFTDAEPATLADDEDATVLEAQ